MCYDISFTVNIRVLSDYFPDLVLDDQMDLDFDANVHVVGHLYGKHPIIYTNREDNKPHLKLMEWGVIPHYMSKTYEKILEEQEGDLIKALSAFHKKLQAQRKWMLNARSERILVEKKVYWYTIRNRRCLIPVTGIYEHRGIKGWKNKVPYHVKLSNQPIFFLPGLYALAEIPNPITGEMEKHWTFTLITRDANEISKDIHNEGDNKWRMPLYLPFEIAKRWIAEDLGQSEYEAILDYEMPSEELECWPVFTIRSPKQRPDNNPKNEYWEWEKLPVLGELNPD